MDSIILFILRIALIAVLWIFIFIALNTLRKDISSITTAPTGAYTPGKAMRFSKQKNSGGRGAKTAAKATGAPTQLTVVEGPLTGSHLPINQLSEITIGRADDCAFVVDDDFASSKHARLSKRGNDWVLEDLDSRNGTFLDGMRIDQPEKVSPANDIKVGRTTLRLVP